MSVPFPVERDILTALSFLGFVLATIPLTWQLEGQCAICAFILFAKPHSLSISSLECWLLTLWHLDQPRMSHSVHQSFDLEEYFEEPCTDMVRNMFVSCIIHAEK